MNNIIKFENNQVEVFEFNGQVLFNPYHCGRCLDLTDSAVRMAIGKMNNKQVIKLTNSDVKDIDIRRLNNAGENFLTESGVYKLIFKSHKPDAEKFQDWVTDDVLPSIRKRGVYITQAKTQQKMFNAIKAEVTTLIDDIVSQKINEIEDKCSQYYRPVSKEKQNIVNYIKKRLGIDKADEEYELVKQRVLIKLGGTKWEDIPVETLVNSLNIIDESIRIIKFDRTINQISLFD